MNRRLLMFTAGAMVALLAVWFLLLWSPKGGQLADARERKQTAEQKVNELQLNLARLQDGKRREPELRAVDDRLRSAVPEDPQLAQFILDANDAAAKAGVDFMSITPSPTALPKVPGQPPTVAVKLQVSGDYFATLNFLDRLNGLPRIIVLDDVSLRPTPDNAKLNADLGGSIFTTKLPAPKPGVRPAATAASTTTTTVKP